MSGDAFTRLGGEALATWWHQPPGRRLAALGPALGVATILLFAGGLTGYAIAPKEQAQATSAAPLSTQRARPAVGPGLAFADLTIPATLRDAYHYVPPAEPTTTSTPAVTQTPVVTPQQQVQPTQQVQSTQQVQPTQQTQSKPETKAKTSPEPQSFDSSG